MQAGSAVQVLKVNVEMVSLEFILPCKFQKIKNLFHNMVGN